MCLFYSIAYVCVDGHEDFFLIYGTAGLSSYMIKVSLIKPFSQVNQFLLQKT